MAAEVSALALVALVLVSIFRSEATRPRPKVFRLPRPVVFTAITPWVRPSAESASWPSRPGLDPQHLAVARADLDRPLPSAFTISARPLPPSARFKLLTTDASVSFAPILTVVSLRPSRPILICRRHAARCGP